MTKWHLAESPEPESARKRQRLSSPTYDEHFPITQEEMSAFDEIDKQLSQRALVLPSRSRTLSAEETEDVELTTANHGASGEGVMGEGDRDGPAAQEWSSSPLEKPSTTQDRADEDAFFTGAGGGSGFVSATTLPSKPSVDSLAPAASGFTSAAALPLVLKTAKLRASGSFTSKPPDASNAHANSGEASHNGTITSISPTLGGFGPASALPARPEDPCDDRPSSPPPPQPDYDSWFDSDASALPSDALGFKTARTILEPLEAGEGHASQAPVFAGFTSASGLVQSQSTSHGGSGDSAPEVVEPSPSASFATGFASAASIGFSSAAKLTGGKSAWQAPSAEALARAAQKMKQWEEEFVREDVSTSVAPAHTNQDIENTRAGPSSSVPQPAAAPSLQTPLRPALRPMENSAPSPAQLPDTPLASKNPTHYTNIGGGVQMKNKQFKSPLINKQDRPASASAARLRSSLNPVRASSSKLPAVFTFGAASTVPTAVPATPARPAPAPESGTSIVTTSPSKGKSLGMTPRRLPGGGLKSAGKAKFTTPFKLGMAPGEAGRTQLGAKAKAETSVQTPLRVDVRGTPSSSAKGKSVSVARKEYKFFDLNPRPDRKTLASSGLRPQSYTGDELEDMGINVEELREMSPAMAIYYSFYSAELTNDSAEPLQLGPEAAFVQLKELGCRLATQQWVTNHYGLILWKLAGMVCLEPESELDPKTKRWCWREVMRQLRYRYERELNGGSRPALRLISTEDAPAACPMVLCVSSIITWAPAVVDSEGRPVEPHPELEVTDGWYRLRARVDRPLARAVRRGLIKVGTKLAVSGAKLGGDRKESCEILDAYDSTYLDLSGNSTHLAPWHAKLGFAKDPFIATLDSLTPDGGRVPAMDLIVTKAYPIAYLEFFRNEDGSTTKLGPRDEKEELRAQDEWLTRRDIAIAKIRADLERQIQSLEKISEQLYGIAGPRFEDKVNKDDPLPSFIEGMYDEMIEDVSRSPRDFFDYLNYMDAGYLYIHTLDQIRLSKERLGEDIERELQYICPPRNVRDFRVVVAKDARWCRKEPTRTVQITVWDPMRMVFSEGGSPGDIREGQRFLVVNLEVNQPSAWMAPGPGSVIYLISKKSTRWTNIRSSKC
ncbi:hypothetical protein BD311DRAFT_660398 [Dichomitus squalens]|uniref:BRCA2 OB1 domain-containing protein n=1 Tax=Dichomitus squalens TaxID=114155 RepID=A0A4Q9MUB1_9APHY|nr:hypothetical protein BD311DRAFT_660398 [Dichomitus squalens]